MRRLVLATAVCAACIPCVSVATAGEASIPEETVSGRIIDITCYGPCKAESNPKPFEGTSDVVVTQRKTGQQIARVSVEGSRYSLIAPPGRYRIVAIPYPEQDSLCWEGYKRRLHVVAGESKRKRLKVENVCIR